MINITIDCATGAEARQQLMALLGATDGPFEQISIRDEKIAENFEPPKMEVLKDEIQGENSAPKKRRTKAEIAADAIAPAVGEALGGEVDIQSDNDVAETQAQDNKEASKAITADMLKEKAVELIRNNKKPEVTALVKSFGADSVATADKNPIKPEDYVRFMDELNKL